jgi:hypothetical protein
VSQVLAFLAAMDATRIREVPDPPSIGPAL